MKRTLSLKSEALTQLTFGELRDVAGGNTPACASRDCYTAAFTCFVSERLCLPEITGSACA